MSRFARGASVAKSVTGGRNNGNAPGLERHGRRNHTTGEGGTENRDHGGGAVMLLRKKFTGVLV